MKVTTKPRMNKNTAEEKAAISSASRPASEPGAEVGIPLFLRRMVSTATPAMIQRQPIEEEEEELLQTSPANGVIRRQEEEEEELLQPKLTVGRPNDVYEQEADDVADQVMRMPEPVMQPPVA